MCVGGKMYIKRKCVGRACRVARDGLLGMGSRARSDCVAASPRWWSCHGHNDKAYHFGIEGITHSSGRGNRIRDNTING